MKRVTLSHRNNTAVIVSPSEPLPGTPPRSLPRWLAVPYAAWAGITFLVFSLLALVLILPVPSLPWRRRMVRAAARLELWLCGMRVTVRQVGHLPAGQCVVVANHASYIDGVVLFAALPPVFGFVIKSEMDRIPLASLLLRRIGSHFVDRGGTQRTARDTRRLLRRAQAGGAMVFFPEGTFRREPGLGRFRSGAFAVAASSQLPIVPVAIRGARRALPPGTVLPQPGLIEVELAPPQPAPASSASADIAASVRAARTAILERIPEPDIESSG